MKTKVGPGLVLFELGLQVTGLAKSCPSQALGDFVRDKSSYFNGFLRVGHPCLRARLIGLVTGSLPTCVRELSHGT